MTDGCNISSEIALTWTSLDLSDDKSTLVQVMAWCRQAASHYLSQCWPRSMSPWCEINFFGKLASTEIFIISFSLDKNFIGPRVAALMLYPNNEFHCDRLLSLTSGWQWRRGGRLAGSQGDGIGWLRGCLILTSLGRDAFLPNRWRILQQTILFILG